MGQTTSQIESYIDDKRDDLGANLQELEAKVKSVTDWRQQFETRPMTLLGAAFAGGVVLAAIAGRSRKSQGSSTYSSHRSTGSNKWRSPEVSSPTRDKAMQTWENIKGALVGLAGARFKEYAEQVVPGFNQHYHQAESENMGFGSSSSQAPGSASSSRSSSPGTSQPGYSPSSSQTSPGLSERLAG